jgi:hypothetical protein
LEVVITVAILSTSLVFVLRGFSTILFSARLSQDMSLACLLAEEKIWDIEQGLNSGGNHSVIMQSKEFGWEYALHPAPNAPADLNQLDLTASWNGPGGRKASLEISTYLSVK